MKVSHIIKCALFSVLSVGLNASPSFQPPVPVPEGDLVRLVVGPNAGMNFRDGLGFIGGGVGATFNVGSGFAVGVDFSGRYKSTLASGINGGLFGSAQTINVVPLTLNAMSRYFGAITEVFALGAQVSVNYAHGVYISNPNLPTPKIGNFGISAGVPFAFVWQPASFYFMPEFDVGIIGQKDAQGKVPFNLGGNVRIGTLIGLGTPMVSLMVEAKPGLTDFTSTKNNFWGNFSTDFLVGVAINI